MIADFINHRSFAWSASKMEHTKAIDTIGYLQVAGTAIVVTRWH